MDQEGGGAVGAGEDLGVGRDGGDLRLGRGGVGGGQEGGSVEEEGNELRGPVHVQEEAPAGVCQRPGHGWVFGVGGRVVACDLKRKGRLVEDVIAR